jgi:dynein heavy chain
MQPKTVEAGEKSREDVIKDIATLMEQKTPELFDFAAVVKKYPTLYEESMNTVICQETEKYNALLRLMKIHLKDVKRALAGDIGMSDELDGISNSLFNG